MHKITELNAQIAYFTSLAGQTADDVTRAAIQDIIAEIETEIIEACMGLAA